MSQLVHESLSDQEVGVETPGVGEMSDDKPVLPKIDMKPGTGPSNKGKGSTCIIV